MPNRLPTKLLLLFLGAAAGLMLGLGGAPVIRMFVVLPLIFFLPGYAILAAALPEDRKGLPRYILAAGLSLAVVVLGGLVLNLVSALSPWGWLALLCAATAAGFLIACWRNGPAGVSVPPPFAMKWELSIKEAALYSGAFAAVILAFVISTTEGQKFQQAKFTEFWITPDRTEEIGTVEVGMRNAETMSTSYDVELMLDDQMVAAWRNITLQKNESWSQTVDLPGPSRRHRLEAWLFKSGDHQKVYRRVWLASRDHA
jgi:uncharacterized membrane protein